MSRRSSQSGQAGTEVPTLTFPPIGPRGEREPPGHFRTRLHRADRLPGRPHEYTHHRSLHTVLCQETFPDDRAFILIQLLFAPDVFRVRRKRTARASPGPERTRAVMRVRRIICSERTRFPEPRGGTGPRGGGSRPQRRGAKPVRGRGSALGGVVLVHDRLRDAAPLVDLLARGPGPGADLGAALATGRAALLTARGPLGRGLAGGLDEGFERGAELGRVVAAEVDLVGGAVDPEGDRLVGLTPVEVVDEKHLHLLCHA